MSDGYICTSDELELSRNSPVTLLYCLTRGQSFGLLLNAESAVISLTAVVSVFVLLVRKYIRSRQGIKNPMELFMLSLFSADLIQAAGMAMDINWVHKGKVQTGTYCTVQGAIHQLGETGVALSTLIIAIHTFVIVWFRVKNNRPSMTLAWLVIGIAWLFLALFVAIELAVHNNRDDPFETPTPYWCWISKDYTAERIFGQYLWLWLTLFISLASYVPLFFWARGYMTVDETCWWRIKCHRKTTANAQEVDPDGGRKRLALKMIAYPLVYSLLVLPLSVVRWLSFSSSVYIPSAATFVVINIYALSGAFNALLLCFTRKDLFFIPNTEPLPLHMLDLDGSTGKYSERGSNSDEEVLSRAPSSLAFAVGTP